MLYNVDFAIAGLVIMIILLIFITTLYDQTINTIIKLKRLILCLIVTDAFDLITAVMVSFPEKFPLELNYALNTIFFLLEVFCISLFPHYIRAIINDEKRNVFDCFNNVLLAVYGVICLTTPFSHSIFYFDDNKAYQHGYLYLLIFFVPLYFLVYSFITMLRNIKLFTTRQTITIIGFILSAIAGPILQISLPGNRIIDYFALSVAAFIAVLGLETPDFIKLERALKELEKNKRLLETAKKTEEERSKLIHEMTKSASWSIHLDKNRNMVDAFWSDEFFWMLGYEKSEVSKETNLWSESLHPDDAEETLKVFMGGIDGICDYDIMYRLRNKNGDYRWYHGTGELKVDSKTQERVFHGIIQDVHDEKIKDDLTKEKLETLEELKKSQIALKEALKRAEAADNAKSDFLANMSHEIRTPINAVLGMNELITRESKEEQIKEYSANIADAGNALLSLINDILDLSKIEAGKMEIAPANYKLTDLLREVHNIMNIRFTEKGLKFNINCNPEIPNMLYGDEIRIRQILINLLNNALKYTDKGSVNLEATFDKGIGNNINLMFSVIDTGIGIKEENIPSLFGAFSRIDLEHNRKKEGTGLGLSITKSLIELMNGSIDVKSIYGVGSTFIISIPQVVKDETQIGILDLSSSAAKKKNYKVSFKAPGKRILAVDDVKLNLKVVEGLLKNTEVTLDMVESGIDCIDAMRATKYDLVLLDHMMPEMDGIETLQKLQADKEHPNQETPIIMLTANAIVGAKEEYLGLGFSDYLTKPIKPNELDAMLIKYLQ